MPCQCEEANPSDRQIEQHNVAELIVSTLRRTGSPPNTLADQHAANVWKLADNADVLTATLCGMLEQIEETQPDIIYDGRNPQARRLADWWDKHKESDKRRKEAEAKSRKRKSLANAARNKLTDDEFDALLYYHT